MEDYRFKEENGGKIIFIIGVILIAKLFYSIFKSVNVNKEQINTESNSKVDKNDFKLSVEKPKEISKNSWLHSADNFGKIEKGRVL
jgi:hypothetical protein